MVVLVTGATKIGYGAVEQLIIFIQLRVSKVIIIVGRVRKSSKSTK